MNTKRSYRKRLATERRGLFLSGFARALFGTALVVLFLVPPAQGTRVFRGDLTGQDGAYDWFDSGMWSGGIPNDTDRKALFSGTNAAGTIPSGRVFTVTLTDNVLNDTFWVRDGNFEMTLDVDGYTYTSDTTSTSATGGYANYTDIQSGLTSGEVVVNLISSSAGGVVNWPTFSLAHGVSDTTSNGTLRVMGGNMTLNLTNATATAAGFRVGSTGHRGTLEVLDGATLNSVVNMQVATNGGDRKGILRVENPGSTLTVTDTYMRLGIWGPAEIYVKDGGVLQTAGNATNAYISFALFGSSSTAEISGVNSRIEAAGRVVLGGLNSAGGQASVIVEDGGTLKSGDSGTGYSIEVWGTASGVGPSSLTVRNGRVESGRHLLLYTGSSMTVDGPSRLTDAAVESAVQVELSMAFYGNNTLSLTFYDAGHPALISVGSLNFGPSTTELNLQIGEGAEDFAYNSFIELITFGSKTDGAFSNYGEGDEFLLGGKTFRFTYAGGTGSDTVGLTVIPEPGATGLILMGIVSLAALRRLRDRC